MNFTEGNSARTIAMRLLDSAGKRGTLTSHLGCKHFSGSVVSSGFVSSLLGASHDVGVIDGTIQNYSDIFELRFMRHRYNSDNRRSEETGREECKRCRAETEEGCHARETLYLGIWICWWTQFPSDNISLDTLLDINPSTIF
jgi:hypothetical protein